MITKQIQEAMSVQISPEDKTLQKESDYYCTSQTNLRENNLCLY
jgi:hypothetical protein